MITPSNHMPPAVPSTGRSVQNIRPTREVSRQILKPSLSQDWEDGAYNASPPSEQALKTLGNPKAIKKVVVTISEGFQAGDNLILTPEPKDLTLRRLRLESTRPVLILQDAQTPDAYRNALANLKFSHRLTGGDKRRFSLTLSYESGQQETILFGEFVPDTPLMLPKQQQKSGWLYDDSDFDMFLFNIQDVGVSQADFLPSAEEQEEQKQDQSDTEQDWSVSFETVSDLKDPIDQPLGLLGTPPQSAPNTPKDKSLTATLNTRLKDLDW